MGRRPSIGLAAGLLIAAGLGACRRGPYYGVEENGFHCEMPAGWRYVPGGGSLLWFGALDEIREQGPVISLRIQKPFPREEILRWDRSRGRTFRSDPNFSKFPAQEVAFGQVRGTMVSMAATRYAEHAHRNTPLPAPVTVRVTEVFFELGPTTYDATFTAPVELYDTHYPTFVHFLETLRKR